MISDRTKKLIEVDQLSVRIGQKNVLSNISFTIRQGQAWAVVGPSGSGKTTLGKVIVSRRYITTGTLKLHFAYDACIVMVDQQHQFKNYNHFYYQARFNSSDSENSPIVEDMLIDVLQKNGNPTDMRLYRMEEVLRLLKIEYLRQTKLIKLSNGEHKRFQIAQALLQNPQILILDHPFVGLDKETRKILHEVVNQLISSGATIMLISAPTEIPDKITHVMELESGTLKQIYSRESFLSKERKHEINESLFSVDSRILESIDLPRYDAFSIAVHMKQVTVQYGNRTILDRVDWKIRKGEKWVLIGPNGAGKSTLLSLINGDNPQAYRNDIILFDRKRGSGESIWDIKSKIGFVSPELHLYFNRTMTCYEAIASGFSNKIVFDGKLSERQQFEIFQWMKLLRIAHLREKKLKDISLGEQRLVLLARALVKNPPMLILDEPCQGLDFNQKEQFIYLVDTICQYFQKTLIYVSHYVEEIPKCIDRFLSLEKGVAKNEQALHK